MTHCLPVRNLDFTFDVSLVSIADPNVFVTNPTLDSGDFELSLDGAAFAAITTPTVTPAGSTNVHVALTPAQMDAEHIVVKWQDQAGGIFADGQYAFSTLPYAGGIVAGGPGTTSFNGVDGWLNAVNDDFYVNAFVYFLGGPNATGSFKITAYTASTRAFTVDAMPQAPDPNDRFIILGKA